MAWDGTFDWRQDSTVFARKWVLYIKPDNEIRVASAVVLDYGTEVILHNDGFAPPFKESVILVRDQGDRDKNINAAKELAEKLVRALYR
ncbi:hypothetical protein J7W19_29145 [Streptomyces mobaraensis NBRC 13819 = DSM 40847]|uniref:Uncharacterized protein n=1 Tax=Streptomyces mobaraensis (strain ATCC 29032 / DSM 40847 / JCM 4168 / NBRC 13819 / NCIMB 11159 / IPCR 16-22) TaxID=1223523 RepID=M3BRY6_STRM1|nr:hypothetical protein [Streptomyces mobaraensis]EMF02445.1 hypothetical protein H340_01324 [Streptomyces mobaraensis NBRC 13819 = DSM 40847]QTT76905.1 hypothetical protein J7W19_29145 [Streptomyces mobaraensis NBRC 13819 = DSM 40847]